MTLQRLFHDLGRQSYLRSDNCAESTAKSMLGFLADHRTRPLFIEPGYPCKSGKCEGFNERLRGECLNAAGKAYEKYRI